MLLGYEDKEMKRSVGTSAWILCLILGTSCATVIHEAVDRDMRENATNPTPKAEAAQHDEDETAWVCPPGKIQNEDCRELPCKVTCEDPKDPKH
jgi:hypothetical protein